MEVSFERSRSAEQTLRFTTSFPSPELRRLIDDSELFDQFNVAERMRQELEERGLTHTTWIATDDVEAVELIQRPEMLLVIVVPSNISRITAEDQPAIQDGIRLMRKAGIVIASVYQDKALSEEEIVEGIVQGGFAGEEAARILAGHLRSRVNAQVASWESSSFADEFAAYGNFCGFKVADLNPPEFHPDKGSRIFLIENLADTGGTFFYPVVGGPGGRGKRIPWKRINDLRSIVQLPLGCRAYYRDDTFHVYPPDSVVRAHLRWYFRERSVSKEPLKT